MSIPTVAITMKAVTAIICSQESPNHVLKCVEELLKVPFASGGGQDIYDIIKMVVTAGPKWTQNAPQQLHKIGISMRKHFYHVTEYTKVWPEVVKSLIAAGARGAAGVLLDDMPALIPQMGAELVSAVLESGEACNLTHIISKMSADEIARIKIPHMMANRLNNIPHVKQLIATTHMTPKQITTIIPFCKQHNIEIPVDEKAQLRAEVAALNAKVATLTTRLEKFTALEASVEKFATLFKEGGI